MLPPPPLYFFRQFVIYLPEISISLQFYSSWKMTSKDRWGAGSLRQVQINWNRVERRRTIKDKGGGEGREVGGLPVISIVRVWVCKRSRHCDTSFCNVCSRSYRCKLFRRSTVGKASIESFLSESLDFPAWKFHAWFRSNSLRT